MDLFDLYARISMDSSEYERGLSDAEDRANTFGDKIKSGLATAAKVGAAALAAAGAAIVAVTKQAVEAYADYEQLVGGVDTLFKNASATVQAYAANAYKTAGLSANEYMETVTSFSASLLQSLGGDTEAAAKAADMAITDMSDNANKMGTDMESIQNAYQGFAKANYTMLDNLKLGYGGTKEEMERLLADAEKLSGQKYDISSYADIVDAIHVVQTEMGITGTTAAEAASTISGSVASMKAAWQNMLVGIADDNADFGTLIGNLVESVSTAAGNILPRIEVALGGISQLISNLAPIIADALPGMLESTLPSLISGATSLVKALGAALPGMLSIILQQLPVVVDGILTAVPMLMTAFSESTPQLIETAVSVLMQIVQSLIDKAPEIVLAAIELVNQLIAGIIKAIPTLVAALPQLIESLITGIIELSPELIVSGIELIAQLIVGLIQATPQLIAAIPEIILAIVSGLVNGFGQLIEKGREIVSKIKDGFKEKVQEAKTWGKDLIQNFIDGLTAKWQALKDKVKGIAQSIKDFLGFSEPKEGPLSNFHTYAPDMMELFAKGIEENEHVITDQLEKSFDFGGFIANAAPSEGQASYQEAFSAELRGIRDDLRNMKIYLSNGKLVGGLIDDFDNAFGRKTEATSRRNLEVSYA